MPVATTVSTTLAEKCTSAQLTPNAVDRLLWDEFDTALNNPDRQGSARPQKADELARTPHNAPTRRIAVIADPSGALTFGVIHILAARSDDWQVTYWNDSFSASRQIISGLTAKIAAPDHLAIRVASSLADACDQADMVIGHLPKSLSELDETAALIAQSAAPDVTVLAGGRVKYMTPAMNETLSTYFAHVHAGLGRQKSRTLHARGIRADVAAPAYPIMTSLDEVDLHIASHGGVFASTRLDIGTRELLPFIPQAVGTQQRLGRLRVLDLGCGSGILATVAAQRNPTCQVIATDDSHNAVRSTYATALANNVPACDLPSFISAPNDQDELLSGRQDSWTQLVTSHSSIRGVIPLWDDTATSVPDNSIDVVLCNPPFHERGPINTELGAQFFLAAARVLCPGGQMWTVFNRHLPYRGLLRRLVGKTTVMHASAKFTVTRSMKPQ